MVARRAGMVVMMEDVVVGVRERVRTVLGEGRALDRLSEMREMRGLTMDVIRHRRRAQLSFPAPTDRSAAVPKLGQ